MIASRWQWALVLVGVLGISSGLGACSSGGDNDVPLPDGGNPDGQTNGDGGFFDDDSGSEPLVIDPADPVLDVSGPNVTTQFHAVVRGTSTPVDATWTIERAAMGSIDKNGLFTASGEIGGVMEVSATYKNHAGSTHLSVKLHVRENPDGVDPATQAKLKAGGGADPSFRWLYPYDETVFPRGLPAPLLQFDGGDVSAAYVKIDSKWLDYEGFYGSASPARVALSAAAWRAMTLSTYGDDPIAVKVTKVTASDVTGPISETWRVAPGSLKGTVYYNTYDSKLAGNAGAVMRMKLGEDAEVLLGGCTVCHTISTDGSTLVSAKENESSSFSYDLKSKAYIKQQGDQSFAFGGLYPDGTVLVSHGNPHIRAAVPHLNTPFESHLYDTKTGAILTAPGFDGVVQYAGMPAFSPDGKHLVFNHFDVSEGHTLAVMDFDRATNTFSGLTDVAHDDTFYLGWPAFLPDSRGVLYHADSDQEFGTWNGSKADIEIANIASGTDDALDALNGLSASGTTLPYGDVEAHQNYEPTLLPVAVGGYYWVVFTSRRAYGNVIAPDPEKPDEPLPNKLWVAAVDMTGSPGKDRSHPAFYLSGQELESGNMRGFWALDPCKQNSNDCESGDECCSGFCRQTTNSQGHPVYTCVPPPGGCAQEFEKCTSASDCCGESQGYQCINGHCARPVPH